MRKITVLSMITLDGILQSPGSPTEDTSDGFDFGGWTAPYGDDSYDRFLMNELKPADYLLGRLTFEIWEEYWPRHREYWPGINEGMKYVLSTNRKATDWENTTFIQSVSDIKKIKETHGPDIQVWGSSGLTQLLLQHDLVDELKLLIHPLILGKGKRWFDSGSIPSAFTLSKNTITSTGVIIAEYKRAGQVKTGTVGAE